MISPARENRDPHDEVELRAALIERCGLSGAAIDRINAAMRETGMTFSECAVDLAFVTREDVESSAAWLAESPAEARAGLVEEALRKLSERR